MRCFITTLILLVAFMPGIARAKRKAPPKVEPVVFEGVRCVVPNDDGRRAYIQAWDTTTNKMLWEATIFRNFIVPLAEEDVQHVYIKKMSISEGKLILVAEDERVYSLDTKTRAVRKLKSVPKEKTQANKSLQATATAPVSWTGAGNLTVTVAFQSQAPVAVPDLTLGRSTRHDEFG